MHRDDHYHLDPTWFLDRQVIITEKMDGGVTGINAGKAYARSSEKPATQPWFNYVKSHTVPKLYSLPDELVCWGEDLYGIHSIEYDPLPDTFFLFHVLERQYENIAEQFTTGDRFWAWKDVCDLAAEHGMHHVPVLFEGSFDRVERITEWFMDEIKQPSAFGPVREGFVMRGADGFLFDDFATNVAKFVRAGHVQTNSHWTKNWKPARILR